MAFELPALPYDSAALEPHITAHTLSFHHAKHHNAYVTNLNNLIKDTDLADKSLEDIMKASQLAPSLQKSMLTSAHTINSLSCSKPQQLHSSAQAGHGWLLVPMAN